MRGAQAVTGRANAQAAGILWGKCTDADLVKAKAQCAQLSVPLDYERPKGTTISLALSRVRHTVPDGKYQGVMLVNPGGPGGSGLALATLGGLVPKGAGNAYDWIGFDPRGVGASKPALSCSGDVTAYNRPSYVPVTAALEKTWRQRSKDYARKCAKAGGELLDHVKSADNVRDMDSIRRALGVQQINYYGFSYGTYLGQLYASRYPRAVRRMILDGVIDARTVWYRSNLDQNVAFDRNANIYFDWIAKNDKTFGLGRDGRSMGQAYYGLLAKLRKSPAGGVIGPDEVNDVVLLATYNVSVWPVVAAAFAALVRKGDSGPVKKLYDENYPQGAGSDNGYAMYLATLCTDARWPQDFDRWKRDAWRQHAKAPFVTWANTWYNAPCLSWAAQPGRPAEVDGRQAPPVLLISETLDAATSFEGALETRRRFPKAALVEGAGGTTHASSLSGVACVDNTVADYLERGALPARRPGNRSDRLCDPLQPPAANQPAATGPAPAADQKG
ncbi:alpha/beta hydrolase [Actinoplanes bogorensis]|uniref:Alpha/beta hydrolase n=1 Tax=Paractinoplanes bogorensis TaxID=1610840 RepID=A0ABS5YQQ8_9ACTN|nr:alpha/beta hydrolase [Actinoplanes bogorensis]